MTRAALFGSAPPASAVAHVADAPSVPVPLFVFTRARALGLAPPPVPDALSADDHREPSARVHIEASDEAPHPTAPRAHPDPRG
jgi:hypothetical protein